MKINPLARRINGYNVMAELKQKVDEINELLSTLHVHLMNIDAASERIKRQTPEPLRNGGSVSEPDMAVDSLSDHLDAIGSRIRGFNNLATKTELHLGELI